MNEEEINITDNLIKEIEINLKKFVKIKDNIKEFIKQLTIIKENLSIYDEDNKNNFKNYYIGYLEMIKEKTDIEDYLNILDVNKM